MLSNYIALSKKYFFRKGKDENLLVDNTSTKLIYAKDNATQIILLADGKKNIKDLLTEIITSNKSKNLNFSELLVNVISLLKSGILIKDKVEIPNNKIGRKIGIKVPPNTYKIYSPLFMSISVTGFCNLKCMHCFQVDMIKTSPSLENILRTIDIMYNIGVTSLQITGGEPFVRKDIFEIIEYATNKIPSVSITTNGTLLTPDVIKKLSLSKIKKIQFGISELYDNYDKFVGVKGSFKKLGLDFNLLVENNIKLSLGIAIMKTNVNNIINIVDYFRKKNVTEFNIDPLVLKGNAKKNQDILKIDKLDWKNLLDQSYNYSKKYKNLEINVGEGFMFDRSSKVFQNMPKRERFCEAGISLLHIDWDGGCYPCSLNPVPEFKIGNIFEMSESEFLFTWNNSQILKQFRDLTIDKIESCNNCSYTQECAGGCRMLAYIESKKLDGKFPFCDSIKYYLDSKK